LRRELNIPAFAKFTSSRGVLVLRSKRERFGEPETDFSQQRFSHGHVFQQGTVIENAQAMK